MTKIISYFLQSLLIYLFFLIGKILGLKTSRKFFSYVFSSVGPLFKSKKIIKKNLDIFCSQIPSLDQREIINNMWKNYGMTFIEYIFLNHFRKNKSHITLENEKILLQIIDNKKPVIFISGHFANFELMSMEITKKNIPLATIYRPLNNFFLNPFMEYLRKKYVCQNQIKKGLFGVKETIGYLKRKHSIALMIDQRVSEGSKIDFFNKPAYTTTLPAQLSIKFDIDVIPVYIERIKNDKFKIEFQERISPKLYTNKMDFTKKLNKILEDMVLRNPNQWIWTHNRWK
tara:strand:- start:4780 stop:5637 length:858 start_codon:yes stop_codon:yes gene_type:complete